MHRSWVTRTLRSKNRNTLITVLILGCIIFIILLGYTAFSQEANLVSLKQVHIIVRHGDKTPSWFYKNDPYKNHSLFSIGKDELTNKGKLMMYELGRTLRKRYKGYLSDFYSPSELLVRSSYASRCQMSALTLLAGLFPPLGEQVWNPDLLWQPIPINTVPRKYDNIIATSADCPGFAKEKEQVDRQFNERIKSENNSLFTYLSSNTGEVVDSVSKIEEIYGTLLIESRNDLKLPDWTKTVYPEELRKVAVLNFDSFTHTLKLKRLQAGPMLVELADHMTQRVTSKRGLRNLYLYMGHDRTIYQLKRALDFKGDILVDFGAAFIIELHFAHNLHYVSVYEYKSGLSTVPEALAVPNCGEPCPLSRFLELTAQLRPEDWREECQSNS